MLRAEFPVHRNSTLRGRSVVAGAAGGCSACVSWPGRLRIRGFRCVDGALPGRQESFPSDALRICDPALLTLSVAAGRRAFLRHETAGWLQAPVDFLEFTAILNLNAQMPNSGVGIEPNALIQVGHRHVDLQVLHEFFLLLDKAGEP